ncbi:MAG: phosphoribosyltransferase [Candidatus Aminicenantes bacterium]
MFEDRKDAGKKLALALKKYRNKGVLVLAIPRGGVEVGYQVARYLRADLSLLICRKLPYPDNPEAGFGAVAEDGSTYIIQEAARWLPQQEIQRIIDNQIEEIQRRIEVLREGKPLPEISGRTAVLIDDGLAMGSTMRSAIMLCRKKGAHKIVVAVPVSSTRVIKEIDEMVDETVVLETPVFFRAVAQVYRNWYDVSDGEVLAIMRDWEKTNIEKKTNQSEGDM